jgi:hypothetical protein
MPNRTLDDDATITDVVRRLNAPTEYVRRVVANMWECKRQFGAASVRIGLLGEARAPNYRIEYPKGDDKIPTLFASYRGQGHKEDDGLDDFTIDTLLGHRPRPKRMTRLEHWSSRAESLDEVSALLLKLRQEKHR